MNPTELTLADIVEMMNKPHERSRERYDGWFRGEVVDDGSGDSSNPVAEHEHLGRVKVRVYKIHGYADDGERSHVVDDKLPWAYVCHTAGGTANSGEFKGYRTGDTIWVVFEEGDPDFPIVVGSWFGAPGTGADGDLSEVPEEAKDKSVSNTADSKLSTFEGEKVNHRTQYPYNDVRKSHSGHTIEMNDTEGEEYVLIKDFNGMSILMDTANKFLRIETHDKVRITLADQDVPDYEVVKGARIDDMDGNYWMMDLTNKLWDIYWQGDKKEEITGSSHIKVAKEIKQESTSWKVTNDTTDFIISTLKWVGDLFKRNGKTQDTGGPHSHV